MQEMEDDIKENSKIVFHFQLKQQIGKRRYKDIIEGNSGIDGDKIKV